MVSYLKTGYLFGVFFHLICRTLILLDQDFEFFSKMKIFIGQQVKIFWHFALFFCRSLTECEQLSFCCSLKKNKSEMILGTVPNTFSSSSFRLWLACRSLSSICSVSSSISCSNLFILNLFSPTTISCCLSCCSSSARRWFKILYQPIRSRDFLTSVLSSSAIDKESFSRSIAVRAALSRLKIENFSKWLIPKLNQPYFLCHFSRIER